MSSKALSVVVLVLSLSAGLGALGCSSRTGKGTASGANDGGPVDSGLTGDGEADVHADPGEVPLGFLSLRYQEWYGPCPAGLICSQTIELGADGRLVVDDRGERYEGNVDERDRSLIVGRAMSGDTIADLRTGGGCFSAPDQTIQLRLDVAPGIYLRRNVTTCSADSITALKLMIRHVAKRTFPAAKIDLTGSFVPGADQPMPPRPFRLPSVFTSLYLARRDDGCADAYSCGELIAVGSDGSVVHRVRGQQKQWSGGSDVSSVEAAAMDSALHWVLRTPRACSPTAVASELMTIDIGEGVFVASEVLGCSDGPVGRVRDAVAALLASLK